MANAGVTLIPGTSPLPAPVKGYTFIDPAKAVARRLIVAVAAMEKCGKSRFALTAPGPIAYMDYDNRSEGTIEPFLRAGKAIAWRTHPDGSPRPYAIPAESGASDEQMKEVQAQAKQEWRRFEDDFEALVRAGVRTIVVDTATEAWELLRLAGLGRLAQVPPHLYSEVNAAYRRLIRLVRSQATTNLILVHKMGKEYENVKDAKGQIKGVETGRKERKGFSETGFLVDVNLALYRLPAAQTEGTDLGFRLRVDDCGANAELRGAELANDMIDFALLAAMITNGETSPEDWR